MSLLRAATMAAALSLPSFVGAQVLRGVVTDTVSGAPIPGAVIRVLAANGDTAAVPGALSDEQGRFTLRLPGAGRWIVETKRIGVRPARSGPLTLAAGETQDVQIRMAAVQPRLSTVRVVDRSACAEQVASAEETATLWEDVRAALTATRITRLREPPTRLTRWARRLDPRTRAVLTERTQLAAAGDTRFFGTPAHILSRDGWIVRSGDGWIYHAPDADGLLSAAFVRDHCFRAATSDSAAGLVGLAFEPAAHRRLPDITGVLWLDRATSELRRLEYRYTRLPHGVAHPAVGGLVDFARRANGTWIVKSWAIRMPEISVPSTQSSALSATIERPTITALLEEGGEAVTTAEIAAAAPGDSGAAATPAIVGVVWDSAAAAPLAGARVRVVGSPYTALTDADGAYRIQLLDPRSYAVTVEHPRIDTLGVGRPRREVRVARGAARLDFALPTHATAALALCPAGLPPGTGIVHGRFGAVNAAALEGEWPLTLRWEERLPGPESRAAWRAVAGPAAATIAPAASGGRRIVLCGVPAGREVRATLVRTSDGAAGELRVQLAAGEVVMRDVALVGRR